MSTYKIASEEGAQRYGVAVGDTVNLKLEQREEQAVIAAGWLEPDKKAKEGKD